MLQWLHSRFELGGSDSRLLPMEGLRGFAASLVFVQHFMTQLLLLFAPARISAPVAKALSSYGMRGSSCFSSSADI
jgi:peptidoglycan/LPS O-acetylase OafA/YrhL